MRPQQQHGSQWRGRHWPAPPPPPPTHTHIRRTPTCVNRVPSHQHEVVQLWCGKAVSRRRRVTACCCCCCVGSKLPLRARCSGFTRRQLGRCLLSSCRAGAERARSCHKLCACRHSSQNGKCWCVRQAAHTPRPQHSHPPPHTDTRAHVPTPAHTTASSPAVPGPPSPAGAAAGPR
jgi:hypothetical protein